MWGFFLSDPQMAIFLDPLQKSLKMIFDLKNFLSENFRPFQKFVEQTNCLW